MHEMVQSYFDSLYSPYESDFKKSLSFGANETYGEIYYYSALKLLNCLKITENDVFLDIGFGIGKLIFQTFLLTDAASVTGIEINEARYNIACNIKNKIEQELPQLFEGKRSINLINGDFLECNLDGITIVYLCCTVFSFELLCAVGIKLNSMSSVQKIVSFRKLPHLDNFRLIKRLFLHCSWDKVPCYIYVRI